MFGLSITQCLAISGLALALLEWSGAADYINQRVKRISASWLPVVGGIAFVAMLDFLPGLIWMPFFGEWYDQLVLIGGSIVLLLAGLAAVLFLIHEVSKFRGGLVGLAGLLVALVAVAYEFYFFETGGIL